MGAGGGKCERPCSGVDSARYLGATVRGSPQSPISLFEQLRRASLQSLFNEPMMASHTFLLFSGRRIVFRRSLCLFWKDHFQPLSRPLVALVGEIEEFSLRFFRSYFRGNARFNDEPENGRKSYEKPPPSFYSNETAAAKRAVQQPRHGFSTQGECASVIPAPGEKAQINS